MTHWCARSRGVYFVREEIKQKEMLSNNTTPHISPFKPKPAGSPGFYALIPIVLLILIGCVAAVVCYFRRRSRLDEMRHRLIPLYNYDPAEEQDEWVDTSREEEEELAEPLFKVGKLSFSSVYGT
ncbi:small integral membrane protein 29-like [Sebastes umbrosus]|uniref:small integral membrane protein 29-like n=1 Tax=Sebastes umbrosus TaxID=72105 RepID=UPI0018A0FEE9|nr:small integral membrane protein 29-like [Sebastes umbrosus]